MCRQVGLAVGSRIHLCPAAIKNSRESPLCGDLSVWTDRPFLIRHGRMVSEAWGPDNIRVLDRGLWRQAAPPARMGGS